MRRIAPDCSSIARAPFRDGRSLAYAIRETLETELASAALRQALTMRQPERGLVFHSDRAVQYASDEYSELLVATAATDPSVRSNCRLVRTP